MLTSNTSLLASYLLESAPEKLVRTLYRHFGSTISSSGQLTILEMTILRVPVDAGGQVPMAGVYPMVNADGGHFAPDHPAGGGVPVVDWPVQYEGNQNLPVQVMVGEYEGEYGNAFAVAGGDLEGFDDGVQDIPPVFDLEGFDDAVQGIMNLFDLEGFDEGVRDILDLFDLGEDDNNNSFQSSDSGYGSMSEYEEEEDDEGENFRPGSPLEQGLPPDDFWQGRRQVDPSVVVSPLVQAGLPSAGPLVLAPHPAGPSVPADPPVSAGPVEEEPAPSTSGLGSSTKRSREENPAAQQRAKRQRTDNGDEDDEQQSTSSGLSSFPVIGYWTAPYYDSDSDDSD